MIAIIVTALITLIVGGGVGLALHKFVNARTLRHAREEAQELVSEAKEAVELRVLKKKSAFKKSKWKCGPRLKPIC